MSIALPTAATPPSLTGDKAKTLLYGMPKVGKSSLAASLDPDHTLFLATEPGLGGLAVKQVPVTTWAEFRQVGGLLAAGEHEFKTVVIDTVDELFKLCQSEVLQGLGVSHAGDLEYGKGYQAITDEFRLRVGKLASLGLGVWFISHAKTEEVKQRVGTLTRLNPTITGKARDWLIGFVDFIFYVEVQQSESGDQRLIRTAATETYEAGGRVALPDPLPLDADALRKAMETACGALAPKNPAQAKEEK